MAAAFDVPSLVVAWRPLLDFLRFPVSGLGVVAAFHYPQHWFMAAEDLLAGHFREARLRDLLRDPGVGGLQAGAQRGVGRPAQLFADQTVVGVAAAHPLGTGIVVQVDGLAGDIGDQAGERASKGLRMTSRSGS